MFFTRKKGQPKADRINFCGLPLPRKIESRHIINAGTTGAGKTVASRSLLDSIRARGDRAIVVDAGGDLLRYYFDDSQDKILAPGDARSDDWSPWAEIHAAAEAKELSKSIIPDGQGNDKEWQQYAQTALGSIFKRRLESGQCINNEDLLYWATSASIKDLAELISGTPAARLFDKGSEKMAASVLSIIGLALDPFSALPGEAGASVFSIRNWVSDEAGQGWLWMPYKDSTASATMPLRRAWLDIAIRAALDLQPCDKRRIWLIIDELPSAGYLPRLVDALARGRKYGLSVAVGIQSISQIREIYGREGAQSLMSNFGTWLVLRQGDNETAEYLSKHVGDRETVRAEKSEADDGRENKSYRHYTNRLLLPSELQRLPDLKGFISLPGDYPITSIEVPLPPHRDAVAKTFIPADLAKQQFKNFDVVGEF